jgi:hypothetical protein
MVRENDADAGTFPPLRRRREQAKCQVRTDHDIARPEIDRIRDRG